MVIDALESKSASSPAIVTTAASETHRAWSARERAGTARIIHFQRKPFEGQYSIEVLFANLREAMRGGGWEVVPAVLPYHSKGVLQRLVNIVWAARNQGEVNHITGDVHFLALGLRGERTILTIHDCHALERLSGLKRWMMRKLWFELPIRRAAVVTVISEETKRQLLRHVRVPDDKIVVIPDAAAPIFRPCPRPFNAACPRILHIGTKENKNLPRLIEALTGLRCCLHIIGPLNDSLRQQLESSGIAYESDAGLSEAGMYRAYCEADIVTLVSTYEGFGMPIIEAQWVERPVVTSNCSSMPEVAGQGACLVDPFDFQSIRDGLLRVINDAAYRESLLENGRTNRERFSIYEVAGRYVSLYDRLAAQSISH
jgi:glycosyltransferase involved in cell wall biosynthesis